MCALPARLDFPERSVLSLFIEGFCASVGHRIAAGQASRLRAGCGTMAGRSSSCCARGRARRAPHRRQRCAAWSSWRAPAAPSWCPADPSCPGCPRITPAAGPRGRQQMMETSTEIHLCARTAFPCICPCTCSVSSARSIAAASRTAQYWICKLRDRQGGQAVCLSKLSLIESLLPAWQTST